MGFQAPRIIGGGQIIQPQAQGNPFEGIIDEINIARDRKQKQELIDLQRQQQYFQEFDPKSSAEIDQYMEHYTPKSQPSLLDLAKDKFGYGEGQWAPGKLIGQGLGKGYRSAAESEELENAHNWAKEKIGYGEGQWAPGKLIKQGIGKGYRSVADYYANRTPDYEQKYFPSTDSVQSGEAQGPQENLSTKAKDVITRPSKRKYESAVEEGREIVKTIDLSDNDAVAKFQKVMGLEPDGIAGKDTIAVIRALQSGEYERATSGYRPDMQIMGIGKQQGGYSLVGGGDLPGKRTGDKNPAMLEDGEYVLNRNAVKAIGKGYLDYINDERYPRFQSGGFKEPNIAGGTAQIVQPPVMDNSEAFSFGGGGGGEEGGGGESGGGNEEKIAMAMKFAPMLFGAPPMQRGGYIPGYQFGGGFSAPGGGARAQIIRPNAMDNSGAFDFGGGSNLGGAPQGGNDPVVTHKTIPGGGHTTGDFSNVDMEWQSGGHVPKYQEGGTVRRPTGYQSGGFSLPMSHQYQSAQSQIEDEDRLRRRQEIMGKIGGEGVQSAADVDTYNKEIEEQVKRQQGNVGGYLDYAFDYMMPEFLEKPMMGITRGVQQLTGIADKPGEENWFMGTHIPEGDLPSSFYDARRVSGKRQMDKYEKEQQEEYQKSALELAGQDPGVLNPEDYAYIQGITSTPSPNPYAGMSNRAMKRLYKEAIQESENNPMDLMKQLYGDEWWKSQP